LAANVTAVKPLISVLIPSYNYARFIEKSIDSVLAQTYENVEIVVLDNRSTDETMSVLRTRFAHEPRVRVFENDENIGLVRNFNRALTHARGEFIVWLCADDWFLKHHLERLYAVFERNPALDIVYTNVVFTDEHERTFSIKAETSQLPLDYIDIRDELPEMLATFCQLCLPAALFRRKLFEELGPLDETLPICADWEFAIRCAAEGKRFAYLAEPSACVRAHGKNASGPSFHDRGGYVVELVQIAEQYLDHAGLQRLFGRQLDFIDFIDIMVDSVRSTIGSDPLPPDVHGKIARLRTQYAARAQNFEPARVREARVSVIMPVRGLPGDAFAAIDSVCAQSLTNWEIIVIDAGGIPLRELIADHPAADRLVYVRLPAALPPGAARNFGLRLARGEYLAFLDEDNRFLPGHLEALVGGVERTGAQVVASSSRLQVVRYDPRGLDHALLASVEGVFRGPVVPSPHGFVANNLPLNALLANRRAFVRAGYFNESVVLLEDFDQIMRFEATERIAVLPDVTLEVYARLGFVGQQMGALHTFYLPALDALYGARAVPAEVVGEREHHRLRVAGVMDDFVNLASTREGIIMVLTTLAGRAFPAAPVQL
jgi:glycosyltransferase involved in cell wall biosynthesis